MKIAGAISAEYGGPELETIISREMIINMWIYVVLCIQNFVPSEENALI